MGALTLYALTVDGATVTGPANSLVRAHDAYPQGLHREPGSTTLASNLSFVHDAAMTVERAAEEETALVEGSFGTTKPAEL